jgi:hypothetical protein
METTININQLVRQIERLDYNDKINILTRIVTLLKRDEKANQAVLVTRLKGLGKNIWQKNDTSSYVNKERESWD